jgi:hypothetical protein
MSCRHHPSHAMLMVLMLQLNLFIIVAKFKCIFDENSSTFVWSIFDDNVEFSLDCQYVQSEINIFIMKTNSIYAKLRLKILGFIDFFNPIEILSKHRRRHVHERISLHKLSAFLTTIGFVGAIKTIWSMIADPRVRDALLPVVTQKLIVRTGCSFFLKLKIKFLNTQPDFPVFHVVTASSSSLVG